MARSCFAIRLHGIASFKHGTHATIRGLQVLDEGFPLFACFAEHGRVRFLVIVL